MEIENFYCFFVVLGFFCSFFSSTSLPLLPPLFLYCEFVDSFVYHLSQSEHIWAGVPADVERPVSAHGMGKSPLVGFNTL